jgi:predicted transcriptional regulator
MPKNEKTAAGTSDEDKNLSAKKAEFRELSARLKEVREVTKAIVNRRKELEARHTALGTELGRPSRQKKAETAA